MTYPRMRHYFSATISLAVLITGCGADEPELPTAPTTTIVTPRSEDRISPAAKGDLKALAAALEKVPGEVRTEMTIAPGTTAAAATDRCQALVGSLRGVGGPSEVKKTIETVQDPVARDLFADLLSIAIDALRACSEGEDMDSFRIEAKQSYETLIKRLSEL